MSFVTVTDLWSRRLSLRRRSIFFYSMDYEIALYTVHFNLVHHTYPFHHINFEVCS